MVGFVITSSAYIEEFLRSFVWLVNNSHFYLKESQKFDNSDNSPLVPWNIPPYFPHNFRWLLYFFFDFFALCTNSFVRSFASSINITGSSLVISHNQVHKIVSTENPVPACTGVSL